MLGTHARTVVTTRRISKWWSALSFVLIMAGISLGPAAFIDSSSRQPWTEWGIGAFLIALVLNGLLIASVRRWHDWRWSRAFKQEMHGRT